VQAVLHLEVIYTVLLLTKRSRDLYRELPEVGEGGIELGQGDS